MSKGPKWNIVVKNDGICVNCPPRQGFENFLTSKEVRELMHDLQDALFEFSPLERKRNEGS